MLLFSIFPSGYCTICNGILNGTGEFVPILPRYWEEQGYRIVVRFLFDVEDNGVWVCDCPCPCCNISTLANCAGVFPLFKILPTRLGVLPIYLIPKLFTPQTECLQLLQHPNQRRLSLLGDLF